MKHILLLLGLVLYFHFELSIAAFQDGEKNLGCHIGRLENTQLEKGNLGDIPKVINYFC